MHRYQDRIAWLGVGVALMALLIVAIVSLTVPDVFVAEAQEFRGFTRVFPAQTAVGQTAGSGALRGTPTSHAIHIVSTGAPTGCTYRLQGSANGSVWYNISAADITCTAAGGTAFETGKPTRYVRGNLLTLVGGTSPTVTLHYVGQ